jgi:hypothetical protein
MHSRIQSRYRDSCRQCIHGSHHVTGIAVGNAFTDPITILDYSHFVYQLGLVDTNTYNEMKRVEERGKEAILEGRYFDAFLVCTTAADLNQTFVTSCRLCFSAPHTTVCESIHNNTVTVKTVTGNLRKSAKT